MARFKVGDRARVVALHPRANRTTPIGTVVTVVYDRPHVTHRGVCEYKVEMKDGAIHSCDGYQLAPIIDPGSWEAIESATGWQPERERA